jgi:hypothetical protein
VVLPIKRIASTVATLPSPKPRTAALTGLAPAIPKAQMRPAFLIAAKSVDWACRPLSWAYPLAPSRPLPWRSSARKPPELIQLALSVHHELPASAEQATGLSRVSLPTLVSKTGEPSTLIQLVGQFVGSGRP